MAKKLFAMEELDESADQVELESSPEEGEVAVVDSEVVEDVIDLDEDVEGIEAGTEAADKMEEVQELVEDAAEGEGLDEVAAEAIRIAIESICSNIGANPKSIYSLYASENFKSASSRKANTSYAAEGVKEFLVDMWKRIKAALLKLWKKAEVFMEKHLTSLGRVKQALEGAKKKLSTSKGTLKDKAFVENAGGLAAAFPGSEVSSASIKKFISVHDGLAKKVESIFDIMGKFDAVVKSAGSKTAEEVKKAVEGMANKAVELGTESTPLVGGVYVAYKFEVSEEGVASLERDREVVEKSESKAGAALEEKAAVLGLINDVLPIIDSAIAAKKEQKKASDAFNAQMVEFDKQINAVGDDAEKAKALRMVSKSIYKMNSKKAVILAEVVGLNVKLAKAVLGYAGLCMKNYKA